MRRSTSAARLFSVACLIVLTHSAASMTVAASQDTPAAALTDNSVRSAAGPMVVHELVFSPGVNQARYRVHEVILGTSDVDEVLGTASDVSGSLSINADGAVFVGQSRIAIDLRTLQTDLPARDEIVRTTTLNTPSFPLSEFYPTSVDHLDGWPTTGDATFGVRGDLVLHGVRRPIRLEVVGHFTSDGVTGTASGTVSLTEFGIDAPRLGPFVAVQDNVTIELDFSAELDSVASDSDPSEPPNTGRFLDQETSRA